VSNEADLLTSGEALSYLGISRATFWRLIRRYDVARYQIPTRGKRVFFKREELDQLRQPVKRVAQSPPEERR